MAAVSNLLEFLYLVKLVIVCKTQDSLFEQGKKTEWKQHLILYFSLSPLGIPWLISSLANSLAESIKDQPIKYSGFF